MILSDTRVAVRLDSSHHNLTLHYTEKAFYILHDLRKAGGPRHTRTHDILHHNLLRVAFDSTTRSLTVSYLKPKKKNKPHASLVVLTGVVQGNVSNEVVSTWAEGVMKSLYEDHGVLRCRRLLVFVNPHGGVGKGEKIFEKVVEPVLLAAGCDLTVVRTTHHGHAFDYVKDLELDKVDAIATVSGDGLIHEVLNGLAQHADPMSALRIPVAPIPAGSGNGLALNLIGIKHGFDSASAALNIVKGRPMKTDLFSITQGGKRSFSFMSQSLGLMADLDLDTEHLRWMGDTRFIYGMLRGIVTFNPAPIQLSIKVAEDNKDVMAETLFTRVQEKLSSGKEAAEESSVRESGALPTLKYLPDDNEDWTVIEDPILFVYAGQGPYVGRDYMAFPVSLPDDGMIDIATSRGEIVSAISGAETGENFWFPKLQYYKAQAYRVKPLSTKGNLSIDGERFPFEEFQVEVHPRLGTFLSCYGRYVADFSPRTAKK
ncbi:hypothetical protein D9611_004729 [Ephemerocybe angulata]|uniref:DAGKc domain-containing protein n=1 Tax=Ephemerocybe angulata TaxID=980116 RepID=A0A8H5B3A5_9AGAR|nr:hypothetical protein D9611_004729 [Tulosesus angulatus]